MNLESEAGVSDRLNINSRDEWANTEYSKSRASGRSPHKHAWDGTQPRVGMKSEAEPKPIRCILL